MKIKKPLWLKMALPKGPSYNAVRAMIERNRLHTVCQEAKCPNMGECFSKRTSAFLILGPSCTRNCLFCAIKSGPPAMPDSGEPYRVAEAVKTLGLNYAVITSVTRDDLCDGGAGHFSKTIKEIRKKMPFTLIEVLVPDFNGKTSALHTVLDTHPNVLNHNLETVKRLYPFVRAEADYNRSIQLLRESRHYTPEIPIKSGIMLGLGEKPQEVRQTLFDLLNAGCNIITLGQYLQPTKHHLPVQRYIPPEEFHNWRDTALKMGFSHVASGPFVRSSYNAQELIKSGV